MTGRTNKQENRDYNLIYTRLSGRFAPIIFFNCENYIFVYIGKKKEKQLADFVKQISWIFKI